MPKKKTIDIREIGTGQDITVLDVVWGSGQGGVVTSRSDTELRIRNPIGTEYSYPVRDFELGERVAYIEVPYEASDCVRHRPDECAGEVDWHSAGGRGTPLLRCRRHADERDAQYRGSMEQYADCITPPDWFDPADAGERWDEDY